MRGWLIPRVSRDINDPDPDKTEHMVAGHAPPAKRQKYRDAYQRILNLDARVWFPELFDEEVYAQNRNMHDWINHGNVDW